MAAWGRAPVARVALTVVALIVLGVLLATVADWGMDRLSVLILVGLVAAELLQAAMASANLAGATLASSDHEGADLTGACLAGADLSGATLPGADLTSAVLTGANLDGTVFESDLRLATLDGAGLAGASARETTWPGDERPNARLSNSPGADPVPDVEVPKNARADRVIEVADGDTVELEQLGGARVVGVDAPDPDTPIGDAATAYAVEHLEGRPVRVVVSGEGSDTFGRALVYIWEPDGEMFNQGLLESGNSTLLPAEPFAEEGLRAAEERAKRLGLGYWQGCASADG